MTTRRIGPNINIMQINIEGISLAKSECLATMCKENEVDILLIQETHATSESDLSMRGSIFGYKLVGATYHRQYGSATYARSEVSSKCQLIYVSTRSDIHTIVISVEELHIMNVYKPPAIPWPVPQLEVLNHPAMYVGDFNSHHTSWGYSINDQNGEDIFDWSLNNNLHLVFDAKDRSTFHSGRWNRGYNPDVCFVSEDCLGQPIPIHRKVLKSFPRSQHRPVFFEVGIRIDLVESIQKPRWNFKLAAWKPYQKQLDSNIRFIPPDVKNYDRFINMVKSTAKKHIPRGFRKEYIPGWSHESSQLYNEFQDTSDPVVADRLIKSLDMGRQEKWKATVNNMDFTKSSRKAWQLLQRVGSAHVPKRVDPSINPNLIASRLIQMSNVPVEPDTVRELKKRLKSKKKDCEIASIHARDFSVTEISSALKIIKSGKAAGFDGMYNEFLIHAGPKVRKWLSIFFTNILKSGNLPPLFQKSKVIAILKPGKTDDRPENFRPISLLSVCYKLLERLIYNRISPVIDDVIPKEQAGFRPRRNCCDQVMALTSFIEIGYQKKLKTGVAFVDLSAAYDTVWKHGLLFKFLEVIPCLTLLKLLNSMLSNRQLTVFVGTKASRTRTLNNGLPQGSVLAPLLFTLYISDIAETQSRKFMYADDIAIAFQSTTFTEIENTLTSDLSVLGLYFKNWRLRPNPSKTEVNSYHLSNCLANEKLKVSFNGLLVNHNHKPKYLGVTLDRSLTYKFHLENVAAKMKTRINIIQKLAGTSWGANADTLRSSSIALVLSVAEYCAPVWLNSHHTNKVDTLIHRTLRIITGTVKSTPLQWLYVLSNIEPPELRRELFLVREWTKIKENPDLSIYDDLLCLPRKRLASRTPVYESAELDVELVYSINEKWKHQWDSFTGYNHFLIGDPSIKIDGFNLPRKQWVILNRLRTGQGRCGELMFLWGFSNSPECPCGEVTQTIDHIINSCPLTKFTGNGITEINSCSENSLSWLQNLQINL